MNISDSDIEIILYSLDILDRLKSDVIPDDKIEMISEHINLAKTALRHKDSKVHLNTVSTMHLSCTVALMIATGKQSADIFTTNKCKEYESELVLLIKSLNQTIQKLKK